MQYIWDYPSFLKYLSQNCHCVNAQQSPEERKYKYHLMIALGHPVSCARRYRDWPYIKIARLHGYKTFLDMESELRQKIKC
jgi:hypothetical protein